MPQVVLDQKRLETLRRQLQGKSESQTKYSLDKKHVRSGAHTTNPETGSADSSNYMQRDLFKILILATLAIGVQLCLYLSLSKNLIHF